MVKDETKEERRMSDATKHENNAINGGYERRDLQPSRIIYFLLALVVATALSLFGLRGLYVYLDHREKADQPAVNPLLTNAPGETRHIAAGYPQAAFPSPKLEEDERGQLNDIRMKEEQTLYSYGWIDEKAGMVHIPIERAMDLLVQRGLPVHGQGMQDSASAKSGSREKGSSNPAAGGKRVEK